MIENVRHGGIEFAIIVRSDFHEPGVHFFTPPDYSQQLSYMQYPPGYVIQPHVHDPVSRAIQFTREALFLRRGRLRVDFYTNAGEYFESRELGSGDVILLTAGGHGFEVLEEIEMIEVKQGPYGGDKDRRRISGITAAQAKVIRATEAPSGNCK